jgi:hypothetical protein
MTFKHVRPALAAHAATGRYQLQLDPARKLLRA